MEASMRSLFVAAASLAVALLPANALAQNPRAADSSMQHDRAAERAAYASHNSRRIVETRTVARQADAADWRAHHPARRHVRHWHRHVVVHREHHEHRD
jgi:hypothetical protein